MNLVKNFNSVEDLEENLIFESVSIIKTSIKKYGNAKVLLSGGSTPINFYKKIANQKLDFKKISFGLIDERFIDNNSNESNEKNIRTCFNNVEFLQIESMIFDLKSIHKNIEIVNKNYIEKFKRIDLSILGMGDDGHTASLFPNDPASQNLMDNHKIGVYNTNSPTYPEKRISLSKDFICMSNKIFLYIRGEKKLDVINNCNDNLPINYFLKNHNNLSIFYSNK